MNLQQLRYLCAIADHGLNVSDAAEALYTYALELACAPAFRRLSLEDRAAKLDSTMIVALRGLSAK